jgi:isopenicillin N synthase-like dioxygenase
MGAETGDKKNVEHKESFSFGHDAIPQEFLHESTLVAENLFPEGMWAPDFQELIEDLNKTAMDILKLLQLAYPNLDLLSTVDETTLYQSFCRSFRYFPMKQDDLQIGNSLHTDWNLLTLVWTDRVGLQVLYGGDYIDYHDEEN